MNVENDKGDEGGCSIEGHNLFLLQFDKKKKDGREATVGTFMWHCWVGKDNNKIFKIFVAL